MTGEYYDLSTTDVAIAAMLILANGAISVLLRLDLEKRLLLAAARTVVQLSLIGYVLEWIFSRNHWVTIGGLMLVMTLVAGISAVRRTDRRFPGIWLNSIMAVMVSSWVITAVTLTAVIRPDVWSDRPAQFAIPLLGMILGNTLTGISLGLDRLSDHLVTHRAQVELLLTLGAGRWESARDAVQQAVRTGMIPILNSMMVVGVVSLPGMMTGQLLAGVSPLSAVKYQIAIMFIIAAATALGTITVVLLSYLRLFNSRHQFAHDRISRAG